MDFIFDNISIIGLGIFVFVMMVSHAMTGNVDESEEETKPYTPLPQNRPVQKKRNAQKRPRPAYKRTTPQSGYGNAWQDLKTPSQQEKKIIQPIVEKSSTAFDSTDIEKTYSREIENSSISDVENKKIFTTKVSPNNNEFSDILNNKNSLRRAFVMSEILGKPKALRRQNNGSI